MIAHQLDLFGGPLKPPKKIKVEEDVPVDVPAPVITTDFVPGEESMVVAGSDNDIEVVPPSLTITNDIEYAPGTEALLNTDALLPVEEEVAAYDNLQEEPVSAGPQETSIEAIAAGDENAPEDEKSFTNEAIFSIEQESEIEQGIPGEKVVEDEEDMQDPRFDPTENINYVTGTETVLSTPSVIEKVNTRKSKSAVDTDEDQDGLNVPPDEELFKRQYYSMRETSAMFGVNQSLLRFWENEFDVLQPKKNKKGDRYFRPVDIKNLVLIHHLLRVRKFTMDGAKDYLQSHKKAGDTFELIRRLEKLKSFLFELKAGL